MWRGRGGRRGYRQRKEMGMDTLNSLYDWEDTLEDLLSRDFPLCAM